MGTASPSASSAVRRASLRAAANFAEATGRGAAASTAMGYTFSTSGLPSSPEGRNTSVMARIRKVATSL